MKRVIAIHFSEGSWWCVQDGCRVSEHRTRDEAILSARHSDSTWLPDHLIEETS